MSGSRIKPHVRWLSGSGGQLRHAVVERAVERAVGKGETPPVTTPSMHLLGIYTGRPTELRCTAGGMELRGRFHPGQAVIHPAGVPSQPRWTDDAELMLLAVAPERLERMAAEEGARGRFRVEPKFHFTDPLLTMLVERLVTEFEGPGPADPLYAESLVQAACAVILRISTNAGDLSVRDGGLPPRRLAEVLDYIHDNLAARVTLEDLAAVAGISASHFTRAFRASTGESPHRYVTQRRLDRARKALLTTDAPIADIALELGFADQSHLTRTMRQHTGVTPRTLRDGSERA
ncbi:helix-turn-helix domain-containing protein [Streptomyces sp. NPDC059063]|uniref:helix-turn-helix domain-containing protein n=1 Tax=unclassified Streptomyces TaxID=2593676 RepID=UPI0036ADE336